MNSATHSSQRFTIKVIPRASRDEVIEMSGGTLKVRLCAPPVDGVANEALHKVLAKHFQVKRSQIRILRGEKSRIKIVEIG